MRFYILPILILVFSVFSYPKEESTFKIQDDYSVAKLLEKLGDTSGWYPNKEINGASSAIGYDLVHIGLSTDAKGREQKKQSKHFLCISCHNTEREDPDLTVSDPEARLDYCIENGIPFLQGTTLYGAVSRRTFYNGDYELKYGKLVDAARNDLRGAIQLCAVECAQGRELKDWELESILMYLWTIDLKVKDLKLTNKEKEIIESSYDNKEYNEGIALLKSKYLTYSPATFVAPQDEKIAYPSMQTDPENGKNVYLESCMYCHDQQKYSFFALDTAKLTMKFLRSKIDTYGDQSIYQCIRYGISSTSGRHSYMPKYPLEKLSKQQLADLRAYIEREAK